jgi:hypothetical protein
MAQIAFLNEHSHPPVATHTAVAAAGVETFLDLMLELRRVLPRVSLVASASILTLQLGDNYSISQWMNETGRDRKRAMLSLIQLAPFRAARDMLGDRDPGVTVYEFDGAPFDGLILEGIGLADLYQGFAVSFNFKEQWRMQSVPVRVRQLLDSDEERNWKAFVKHATSKDDIAIHQEWLLAQARQDIRDAKVFWMNRNDVCGHLRFLPKVEGDLASLQAVEFIQIVAWLFNVNDAVAKWDPGTPTPIFPPHITNEAAGRREYFWFNDGAVKRCFSWHGRYTPGKGRIHFWLSASEKKAVIGYIGPKVDRALDR